MTDDTKRVRDRADKTPDHECRAALFGATIRDVVQVCAPEFGVMPSRDSLYLVLEDGSAVEIEAERLYLDLIPDYEAQLEAIQIEEMNTQLRNPDGLKVETRGKLDGKEYRS